MHTQIKYAGKVIYPTKAQYEQACRDALVCKCGNCFACKCLEHWRSSKVSHRDQEEGKQDKPQQRR